MTTRVLLLMALACVALGPLPGCCMGCPTGDSNASRPKRPKRPQKTRKPRPKKKKTNKTLDATPDALIEAFAPGGDDSDYKDQKVRTTGVVIETSPGNFANPSIDIASNADADPLEEVLVSCRVTDDFVKAALKAKAGDRVTATGIIEGKRFDRVRMEECTFKKAKN